MADMRNVKVEGLEDGVTILDHDDENCKEQMLKQLDWVRQGVESGDIVAIAMGGLHKDTSHAWVQLSFVSDQAEQMHNMILDIHERFHDSWEAGVKAVEERAEREDAPKH